MPPFPKDAYHTALSGLPGPTDTTAVVARLFAQVFRRDFSAPGVGLVSLGRGVPSEKLRRFMMALKESLDRLYRQSFGRRLAYLSLARFNQQVTTKFHLDGSPDEAYLMLRYEPTAVPSAVAVADYTRAAHEWGIEPKQLLAERNPMFAEHERPLLKYVTRLEGFDPSAAQVLLIN